MAKELVRESNLPVGPICMYCEYYQEKNKKHVCSIKYKDPVTGDTKTELPCEVARDKEFFCGVKARYFRLNMKEGLYEIKDQGRIHYIFMWKSQRWYTATNQGNIYTETAFKKAGFVAEKFLCSLEEIEAND